MVFLTCSLKGASRFKRAPTQFLDKIRVYAKAGHGGNGLPKYGGVGGRGGHIVVRCDEKTTLEAVVAANPNKRFSAKPGTSSRKAALLGSPGHDLEISVPIGVSVRNDAKKLLGDLDKVGDVVFVAKGGEGGNGENGYIGQKGDAWSVTLDLKLIADVGLVGFPNAGKSTFMKNTSSATPRIAAFPFTTIKPQLGTMHYADLRKITLADLPGLIEGAHLNVGMGHSFLKHVERTKLLLFMVDICGFQLKNGPARNAFETVMLLNKELELYKPELLYKPALLCFNKMDLPKSEEKFEMVRSQLQDVTKSLEAVSSNIRPTKCINFIDILAISAKKGLNMEVAQQRIRDVLDDDDDAAREANQDLLLQNDHDSQERLTREVYV